MSRDNWKSITSPKGCSWSTWLHESTVEIWAMLCGIPGFFTTRLPEILREVFGELNELAIFGCRVAYHLGKFVGVAAVWLAILLLPLIVYPSWITLAWLAIAVCGSVWGYRRCTKKQALSAPAKKEGFYA